MCVCVCVGAYMLLCGCVCDLKVGGVVGSLPPKPDMSLNHDPLSRTTPQELLSLGSTSL